MVPDLCNCRLGIHVSDFGIIYFNMEAHLALFSYYGYRRIFYEFVTAMAPECT